MSTNPEDSNEESEATFNIEDFVAEYERTHSVPPSNGLITGVTGAGKSVLINEFFHLRGDSAAATGSGRPVTQHINKYTKENSKFTLYDTRGLEIDHFQETKDIIYNELKVLNKSINHNNHIHFIWYCVNGSSSGFQDAEIDFIKDIWQEFKVPTIIVITQSIRTDTPIEAQIRERLPNIPYTNIIAKTMKLNLNGIGEREIPPYGLEDLVNTTLSQLPKAIQISLARVSRYFLQDRYKRAEKIIEKTLEKVGRECHRNIPFATIDKNLGEMVLIMIVKLTHNFDLNMTTDFISQIISNATKEGLSLYKGRYICASLLKIGSVIFGYLSTTTSMPLFLGGLVIENMGYALDHSYAKKIAKGLGYSYLNAIFDACSDAIENNMPFDVDKISQLFQQYINTTVESDFKDYRPRTWKGKEDDAE